MEKHTPAVVVPRVGNGSNEVRIKNIPDRTVQELKNIAAHLGITVSAMLKPKLREIIESYPTNYRTEYKD